MKFRAILISLLILTVAAIASGNTDFRDDKEHAQKVERTIAVDPAVAVSLCVVSGNITVHGWERNEVTARSTDGAQIELRHAPGSPAGLAIKKLEIVVFNKTGADKPSECQAFSDIDLNVPRGATVFVQTRDGDISISDIASAYAGTQNGDIEVEQITRAIEVGSIGGSICLKDSTGLVSVSTAGGSVDATNLRPVQAGDAFDVVTTSGDITLTQVSHRQINTKTVSGNLTMTGPLAPAGRYWFNSFSGDVTVAMPASSSFKITAKVSEDGEIITDFPLTLSQITSASVSTSASTSTAVAAEPSSSATPEAPEPPALPEKPGPVGKPPKAAPPVKIKVAPAVKVKVEPGVVVEPVVVPFRMRRISGFHGTGDATISVASFSGTLRLEQN